MKKAIQNLYSTGTRGVRIFNLAISSVWLVISTLYYMAIETDIPSGIINYIGIIWSLSLITTIMSINSLTKSRYRVMHKYISLHTGALLQAVICVGYAEGYPPLPVAPITAFLFSLWLIGAAYFVMDNDLISTNTGDDKNGNYG